MECMEAIKGRRSIRKFKSKEVEKGLIEELIDAVHMAPSAGNLHSRDLIVVTNKITKQKLAKAALDQDFIQQAPLVIVVVANIERSARIYRSRGELYAIQDATAGVMNLLLAAHARGLAACWVGAFDEVEVSEMLGIPYRTKPVAIVPVGYADEEPAPPQAPDLDRLVHHETW